MIKKLMEVHLYRFVSNRFFFEIKLINKQIHLKKNLKFLYEKLIILLLIF